MHLLEAFLEVEEIACFQINLEPFNVPVLEMIPFFRRVQSAGRPLLVRGTLSAQELRRYLDALNPSGLYLHLMVESEAEVEGLMRAAGM
jgi:hypothetical protein